MLINFQITNITCDACIKLSSLALKKMPSVKRVDITNDGFTALETDEEIARADIINALAKVDKNVSFE